MYLSVVPTGASITRRDAGTETKEINSANKERENGAIDDGRPCTALASLGSRWGWPSHANLLGAFGHYVRHHPEVSQTLVVLVRCSLRCLIRDRCSAGRRVGSEQGLTTTGPWRHGSTSYMRVDMATTSVTFSRCAKCRRAPARLLCTAQALLLLCSTGRVAHLPLLQSYL